MLGTRTVKAEMEKEPLRVLLLPPKLILIDLRSKIRLAKVQCGWRTEKLLD